VKWRGYDGTRWYEGAVTSAKRNGDEVSVEYDCGDGIGKGTFTGTLSGGRLAGRWTETWKLTQHSGTSTLDLKGQLGTHYEFEGSWETVPGSRDPAQGRWGVELELP
jgi:hypothetical protein